MNPCPDCESPKCIWSACDGTLRIGLEQRVIVESKYVPAVKGKPAPPYPKRMAKFHRECDVCGSIFYHFHEIELVPVYDDEGKQSAWVFSV